jgi:hypothetical protein
MHIFFGTLSSFAKNEIFEYDKEKPGDDQYRRGLTDFTSVLDAERQQYQSEADLLQSDTAVTTSLIALYKALGGGWEPGAVPSPASGASGK